MQCTMILHYLLQGPQSVIWTLSKLTYCMDSATHMVLWGALFAAHEATLLQALSLNSVTAQLHTVDLVPEDNQVHLDIDLLH